MNRRKILSTILIIAAASCSLFEPREPESPTENPSYWVQPTTPQAVLSNLENNLEDRNITNYINCLDSEYLFIPDPVDLAEFGGLLPIDTLDRSQDNQLISQVFADAFVAGQADTTLPDSSLIIVSLILDGQDPPLSGDSTELLRDYDIYLAGNGYCDSAHHCLGTAKFYLRADSLVGLWAIYRWEDNRPEESDTTYTLGVAKSAAGSASGPFWPN